MQALTEFLIPGSARGISFDGVEPDTVSACDDSVRLLLKGRNLWRNPEVYVRGRKLEGVAVLPDMAGISVTLRPNELPQSVTTTDQVRIWTSVGEDKHNITIDDSRCRPKGSGTSTNSVSVVSNLTRVVGDGDVILDVAGARNEMLFNKKFLVRIKLSGGSGVFSSAIAEDVVRVTSDNTVQGRILNNILTTEFVEKYKIEINGALMVPGLQWDVDALGNKSTSWADKPFVYYTNDERASIQIDSGDRDLNDGIKLLLPAKMALAYPNFSLARDLFSIMHDGGKDIKLSVSSLSRENGVAYLSLTSNGSDNSKLSSALCNGIKATIALPSNDNTPPIFSSKNAVTLKRSEGCQS